MTNTNLQARQPQLYGTQEEIKSSGIPGQDNPQEGRFTINGYKPRMVGILFNVYADCSGNASIVAYFKDGRNSKTLLSQSISGRIANSSFPPYSWEYWFTEDEINNLDYCVAKTDLHAQETDTGVTAYINGTPHPWIDVE